MATSTVNTTSALYTAVQTGAAGDVITLSPGTYGSIDLSSLTVSAPGLTVIASGVTVDELTLNSSAGIEIRGLHVNQPAGAGWRGPVYAGSADRIKLTNLNITCLTGRAGVTLRNSTNCTITGCEVFNVGVGLAIIDCDTTVISNNTIYSFTVDGMDIAGSPNSTISGNTLHDPAGDVASGVHPDFIQFWETTEHPKPAGNIVSKNVMYRGNGLAAQGIFVESQTGISITGNAMVGTLLNGISLSTCVGGTVDGNYVQGYPDFGARIITRGGSSDVTVSNNLTGGIGTVVDDGIPVSNYVETNNTIIADAPLGSRADMNAWLAGQPDPVTPPPPPPPPPPPDDVQDVIDQTNAQITALTLANQQYVSTLKAVLSLATTASRKKPGPAKSDILSIITIVKQALA